MPTPGESTTSLGAGQVASGQTHQLHIPAGYRYDATRRLVVWCHGAGASYPIGPVEGQLVRAGFPLIACDLGGMNGYTWGDDASLARVTDAWSFGVSKLNAKADKMILWAGSMGGQTALVYAATNGANVAAVGAAIPALDPETIRAGDLQSYASSINAVYGGAVPTSRRPAHIAASITCPVALWPSGNDPICLPTCASYFMAQSHPTGATANWLGNVSHSYLSLDTDGAVRWLSNFA